MESAVRPLAKKQRHSSANHNPFCAVNGRLRGLHRISADQGSPGRDQCASRTVPMQVAALQQSRLQQMLSCEHDRRKEQPERRTARFAELCKPPAETEGELERLYEAILNGSLFRPNFLRPVLPQSFRD